MYKLKYYFNININNYIKIIHLNMNKILIEIKLSELSFTVFLINFNIKMIY